MKTRAAHPWHLVLGLCVWALWFLAVYVGVSVSCAVVPPPSVQGPFTAVNAGLLLLTIATALGLAWRSVVCGRAMRRLPTESTAASTEAGQHRFIAGISAALYGVAAVATVFVGLPLLAMPPCV